VYQRRCVQLLDALTNLFLPFLFQINMAYQSSGISLVLINWSLIYQVCNEIFDFMLDPLGKRTYGKCIGGGMG